MSTRYIKKDNNIIVGIAKNASQAIKQVYLRNKGWEIYEQDRDVNKYIDIYNPDITIYFPFRNQTSYYKSQYLQYTVDLIKSNLITLEQAKNSTSTNAFVPKLSYFNNYVGTVFINEILLNDKWEGAKLKFFDINKFSKEFNEYLGYDLEIPVYNTYKQDKIKVELNQLIEDNKFFLKNTLSRDFSTLYNHFINPFWESIKKSKYWLPL